MHIAIVGCGQLARMLALAGLPLGFTFSFVAHPANEDTVCVQGLGNVVPWHLGDSADEFYLALGKPDVVTVEKEQLDITLLQALKNYCKVYPSQRAVAVCQHRHKEKQLLQQLGIPSADYCYTTSAQDSALQLGFPFIIKSCTEGYDGKNQWVIKSPTEAEAFDLQYFNDKPQKESADFICEKFVPFNKEVSLVSARSSDGSIVHYPLTENVHAKGILKQSIAPAMNLNAELTRKAQDYITRILTELDYVGVLAMECFVVGDTILVNELAPRVHNSGHWTQNGCMTSQFENHILAIGGMSLGSTKTKGVSGMLNIIGTNQPPSEILSPQAFLHWYGKSIRPGRKLGHINFTGQNHHDLLQKMEELQAAFTTVVH